MKRLTLILGVHNHQPVGNFGKVFETLFTQAYEPFAKILYRHPTVKFTFHTTGPLLEWMQENRPAYLERLFEMSVRGQIEFFSGGLYEPILPIIPDRDKVGQIKALNRYLETRFQKKPRGLWIAERVWEPHLPKCIAEAGIEYAPIDDAHFKAAGYREEDTYGHYLTEEQGHLLKVFPISERMRYLVPFRQVNESIDFLRSVATEEGDRCVVLMDDGEKFGGWPDTYKWVYEDGWLENFLKALEDNADWLTTATFAEFADQHAPKGRIYLPAASYTEMGMWALPPDAALEYENLRHELEHRGDLARMDRYLKGGFWRNFLTKYQEANHLQKKMAYVSDKVEEARVRLSKKTPTAAEAALLAEAERSLYRGQCNCPYWHGIFGGLYLNHLRFGVYRELLASERAADALLHPKGEIRHQVIDFNRDGFDEVVVEGASYRAVVDPSLGGSLTEIDYMPGCLNLSDVLTRRKEAYHAKLVALRDGGHGGEQPASIHDRVRTKEPGLENRLFYDNERRTSLVERFIDAGYGAQDLQENKARDRGSFAGRAYQLEKAPGRSASDLSLTLGRTASVEQDGEQIPFHLSKRLSFSPGDLVLGVEFLLENKGVRRVKACFLSEWNLTLLAGDEPDRNYFVEGRSLAESRLQSVGNEKNVVRAGMTDGWLGLRVVFEAGKPAAFLRYPVETVSQSEGGFERVYQGSCLSWGWEFDLETGASARFDLKLKLEAYRP